MLGKKKKAYPAVNFAFSVALLSHVKVLLVRSHSNGKRKYGKIQGAEKCLTLYSLVTEHGCKIYRLSSAADKIL